MAKYNAQSPRVEDPPPRVDDSPGLVVAWPMEAVVMSSKEALQTKYHSNSITQDEEEARIIPEQEQARDPSHKR